MSNIEYSALKRKGGLHNWGYIAKDEFETDIGALTEMDMQEVYSPEVLHQNSFGEYYALQDFEE